MTGIEAVKKLEEFKKDYYTVGDLKKILDISDESLRGQLTRWCKKGLLIRLRKGVYTLYRENINYEKIANQIYYPSYLSFESALSRYGILSQIPYTITFATPKKPKKILLGDTQVEYAKISNKFYFGYVFEEEMYIASPEKALVDSLYFVSKGKKILDIEELYLKNIDKNKLLEFSEIFPKNTRDLVKSITTK